MEDNLILEGLLSMVTELKEKQEAQATPASREETLERLGVNTDFSFVYASS